MMRSKMSASSEVTNGSVGASSVYSLTQQYDRRSKKSHLKKLKNSNKKEVGSKSANKVEAILEEGNESENNEALAQT